MPGNTEARQWTGTVIEILGAIACNTLFQMRACWKTSFPHDTEQHGEDIMVEIMTIIEVVVLNYEMVTAAIMVETGVEEKECGLVLGNPSEGVLSKMVVVSRH